MARQIKAWLGELIESEIENVIAWKSVVKQEPDVRLTGNTSRFEDDGSNFRSTISFPRLNSESKIQLLQTPESRREPALVTDGETQLKAKLGKAAWDSYENALDGEDPMRGDILICRELTVCSTPFGPADERVQLNIRGVEFKGDNVRKTIGQPSNVEQRPRIAQLLDEITCLRAVQNNDDWEDDPRRSQDEVMPDAGHASQQEGGRQSGSTVSYQQALETQVQESLADQPLDSQPPALESPLPSRQFPRLPNRHKRGGYSLARDGVEAVSGVNLSVPHAPGHAPRKRDHDMLLGLLNRKPATTQRNAPLPAQSIPVSAQVASEEKVLETPAKPAKPDHPASSKPATLSAENGTPPRAQRKSHRIPVSQRRLLDNKFSWFPPAPGSRFPHPNVPIKFLERWNSTVQPPTPALPIEASTDSEDSKDPGSSSEVGPDVRSESEVVSVSDDDEPPLSGWSQSPSQRTKLPPDSSANSPLERRDPLISSNGTEPRREHELDFERSRSSTARTNESISCSIATPAKEGESGQLSSNGPARNTFLWNGKLHQLHDISAAKRTMPPSSAHSSQLPASPRSQTGIPSRSSSQASAPSNSQDPQGRSQRRADNRSSRTFERSPRPSRASQFRADRRPWKRPPETIGYDERLKYSGQASLTTREQDEQQVSANERFGQDMPTDPRQLRYSQHYGADSRGDGIREVPNDRLPPRSSRYCNLTPPTGPKADTYRSSQGSSRNPDDLEMEVPRALNSNHYQMTRREFFRGAGRRRWIKANFPLQCPHKFTLETLWQSYCHSNPSDAISLADFVKAIEVVHPGAVALLSSGKDNYTAGFVCDATAPPRSSATPKLPAIEQERPQQLSALHQRTGDGAGGDFGARGNRVSKDEVEGVDGQIQHLSGFAEFAVRWKSLGPGGAFARKVPPPKDRVRRVDVLSWGFGE